MKLLIFSDTHGSSSRMLAVATQHADAGGAIFLGDGTRDAERLAEAFPALPLYIVSGNCDFGSLYPNQALAPFAGQLVLYTHGHTYSVKSGLGGLLAAAKRAGASIALYGHTHVPHHEYTDGVHVFNPGSLSLPRAGGPTYGVITVSHNMPPVFEIKEYLIGE